jgi:hypothetical protein
MKVIYNNIIPFDGYLAMTVFPFIFARGELNEVDINHESIHGYQQIEVTIVSFLILLTMILSFGWSWWLLLLSIPTFYVLYGIDYIIRYILYPSHKEAYRNICFEQEAFMNEGDFTYLKNRKLFSWVKYITQKTYKYQKPLF